MESIIGNVAWSNIPMGVHWAFTHICIFVDTCIYMDVHPFRNPEFTAGVFSNHSYFYLLRESLSLYSWILDTFISQFALGDISPISPSQGDNTGDTYRYLDFYMRSELTSFKLESTGFIH